MICLIFLLIMSFSFEIFTDYYTIEEFFYIVKSIEISESDSIKIINDLTKILERYVFLDIIKNPPQPPNKENYYNQVNLIEEIKLVKTGKRSFYEFYRDIRIIIDKCQDGHLRFYINENFEDFSFLRNSLLISPVFLYIEDKNVYSLANNNYPLDISIIEDKPIKSINGLSPFEYIQKFNDKFLQYKSPQAQFVVNLKEINNPISLIHLPLDYSNLSNITIIYDNNSKINYDYRVEYKSNLALKLIYISYKIEQFFYDILDIYDFDWDITLDDGKLKCYVDDENKVNVIYQETFHVSDLEEGLNFFDECFSNFDNNIYPIIIIESFNGGGYGDLADYFISYINLNKSSTIYSSYRYNEQTEKYIAPLYYHKSIDTCQYKNYTYLFNSSYNEDNYGFNSKGEEIKHKRTKLFDFSSVNENYFYSIRKKAKHIRKPNEIIIYTDGYSYSATCSFIRHTQLKGGAIIVGYDGNPFLDTFDASQSPSSVQSTNFENTKEISDKLSSEIESLGFTLSYTIGESFSEPDYENKSNIPLEYQIYEIDERVKIFNGYYGSKYQSFIDEAKKIFKKYEIQCNPKNKNLLLINEKCYLLGPHLHGGFPCGENGFWNKNECVPSYCDIGYVYDKRQNRCIKDVCFKKKEFNYYYYNHDDDRIEISNISTETITLIGLFSIFQVIFILILFTKKFRKNKKKYIIIIVVSEILLIIISYIFYNLEIKEII